jgi:hypothetical protein
MSFAIEFARLGDRDRARRALNNTMCSRTHDATRTTWPIAHVRI